ncbi:MAG: hypothetical protein O7G87_10985 [bacterium]|nr:hypothetical protein [bacterium]
MNHFKTAFVIDSQYLYMPTQAEVNEEKVEEEHQMTDRRIRPLKAFEKF